MQKATKKSHIIHDTGPADIIVWVEKNGEGEGGEIKKRRQKEKKVGTVPS